MNYHTSASEESKSEVICTVGKVYPKEKSKKTHTQRANSADD